MNSNINIKTMKLYHHPERIYNELKALGIEEDSMLTVEQLAKFDQYHYFGTDAVDDAIQILSINSKSKVIEVGSGIGGPARYLANKTNCHVTALELQPDLHNIAYSLTKCCKLNAHVEHLCDNIFNFSNYNNFDVLVSLLVFLHIPDRKLLLKKCYEILRLNGRIFIEDFYERGQFNDSERKILSEDVYCDYLPTLERYRIQLIEGGFTDVQLIDKTVVWTNFVKDRTKQFIENRQHNIDVHGIEIVEGLEYFYQKMSCLFENGNLGGVRIIARKT